MVELGSPTPEEQEWIDQARARIRENDGRQDDDRLDAAPFSWRGLGIAFLAAVMVTGMIAALIFAAIQ